MKKLLDESFFINRWLKKYHNTTIERLIETEPELCKTSAWFKKYAVTEEQHDEWHEWAINYIAKYYRMSKKMARRQFAFPYLNVAPSIKK